jgi:hypothetical protein
MTRNLPLIATIIGTTIGLAIAFSAVAAQRAWMIHEMGWVCASDWPGMILLYGVIGGFSGWFLTTRVIGRN